MQFINRFTIFTKRILVKKPYLFLLFTLIILTTIYVLLPTKSQSADIKIGIYCEDDSDYYLELLKQLEEKNSIYTFYSAPSKDSLIDDVNSLEAECGYYIPKGFFNSYIQGHADTNPVVHYVTPASILSSAVSETFFSVVMQVCSTDILNFAVNIPKHEDELSQVLEAYMNSDSVFRIQDVTDGNINYKTYDYKIDIPVYELSLILLLASGLMGLLLYYHDKEKGSYTPLSSASKQSIKLISIITAVVPVLFVGALCTLIVYGSIDKTLSLLLFCLIVIAFSLILSICIRNSKQLATIIPIILLLGVIGSFAYAII